MQRDGRLASAGATLNDEHALELRADDAILLGLDRRDDVRHATGPLGGESGEQRTLALELSGVALEQRGIEDLVLDTDDAAPLGQQVAACPCTEWGRGSGLVERAGLRNTPVEQDRLLVFVAQPDPADVPVHGFVTIGFEFETAEGESLIDLTQLHDAVLVEAREGVALRASLMIAADVEEANRIELLLRLEPQRVQSRVEGRHVVLLALQLVINHSKPLEIQHSSLVVLAGFG